MSNVELKMGQSSPTHNYLIHYTYEVPDPYEEDGENWSYDGEISTHICSETFKNACDEAEGDGSRMYPDTNLFSDILDNALLDVDTSNWENIEFSSATPFDKRKRSWG